MAMNLQYLENFCWVEDKHSSTTRLALLVKIFIHGEGLRGSTLHIQLDYEF